MTVELFEPIARSRRSQSIFPLRENEPEYARLNDPNTQERNRYGDLIELKTLVDEAVSLNINGVSEIGFNPNRHKQHAFHFTADNCIGCHACESACSEKNDLPPHLSFRSVGYVEGGSYPNYTRMNISMACNHCDDPVCLKGCPTRAYTKHPEYGAVIQDPNICFGCGYCTWVCPYNAPQLDPVAGQVEKCNMCVDRLEVGLKPACVSACLGNALNFGVVENTPQNREQIETSIPGFPDPEITHPNIRFQQTRSMPREVTRTDSMPVKYQRDDKSGRYRPVVDQKAGKLRSWNLSRLSSRENPLVVFTLATQAAIGMMATLFLGTLFGVAPLATVANSPAYPAALLGSLALVGLGLLMSAMHLGKPLRFYRGFNNYRHSPVAREGLGALFFMVFTGLHFLCVLPTQGWLQSLLPWVEALAGPLGGLAPVFGVLALAAGSVCVYYMYRCYRIKARPFWNHWQTATSFVGTALHLGAIATALLGLPTLLLLGEPVAPLAMVCAGLMLAGLLLEGIGLWRHAHDMNLANSEGAVSHYVQCTTFGKTYLLRNALLGASTAALLVFLGLSPDGIVAIAGLAVIATMVAAMALIGRALFYVLVVPTTMPGAFFWKNKGFEEHAREIGLANMPQVGVVPHAH